VSSVARDGLLGAAVGQGEADGAATNAPTPQEAALHKLLLDSCVDAIVAHTPEGVLLYANDEALRQWGCDSFEQIRAKGPWGWVPPQHRRKIAHRLGELSVTGEARFESGGGAGCGGTQAAEIHARYIEGADGRPVIVAVARDISNRMRTEEMVRYLAYHDSLTGLANRPLLGQELAHAIAASDRHEDKVGLVFLDLDDFKPINDTLGHARGDHALRKVAGRISSCVRLTDTVARVGGDEFIVLLPRLTCADDLHRIAHKIADEVAKPMSIGDSHVTITASLGLALYHTGESPDEFVARADRAMYESKGVGVPGWSMAAT